MKTFLQALDEQRWDDHRYYHQSRINQTLHLLSAISFLFAYALLFVDPAAAGLLGWGVSMVTRQAGHFFFEPRGYDLFNKVTDAHKEAVKVGYNMRRKAVLLAVWAAIPALLWISPSLFGLIEPARTTAGTLHDIGIAWLALAAGGIALRVAQLWWSRGGFTAWVWVCKLATDPLWDIQMYWRSPAALLRGELVDPAPHIRR